MKQDINIGDTVRVDFNSAKSTLCKSATVMHKPQATGDSWIFHDDDNGFVYYVSEGCTISKKFTPYIDTVK